MADFADKASELSEQQLADALAKRSAMTSISAYECEECGDDIPEQRRSIGGVTRCIGCQTVFEIKQRMGDA